MININIILGQLELIGWEKCPSFQDETNYRRFF